MMRRGKTDRKVANGDVVVREPTCIWPTRRINIVKLERNKRIARKPHDPKGNHDHKT